MKRSNRMTAIALAAAATLAFSACSGGGSDAPDESAGTGEPAVLKMVSFPLVDFAPVLVAQKKGFFEEEGVKVEFADNASQSANDAAALLASGDFQLAYSNVSVVAGARAQGLDVQLVVGGTVIGGPDDESFQIVTRTDGPSDLQELADSGAPIGATGTATQVYTMNAFEDAGIDPTGLTFQAVPYPQAAELILNGSVASHTIMEPFLGAALQNPELRAIASPMHALPENTPSLSVITSQAFAEEHPEQIEAVRKAIIKADAWIADPANLDELLDLAAEYTGQDRELLASIPLPMFNPDFSEDGVADFLQMYVKYGFLEEMPADISSLGVKGAFTS